LTNKPLVETERQSFTWVLVQCISVGASVRHTSYVNRQQFARHSNPVQQPSNSAMQLTAARPAAPNTPIAALACLPARPFLTVILILNLTATFRTQQQCCALGVQISTLRGLSCTNFEVKLVLVHDKPRNVESSTPSARTMHIVGF